MDLEKAVTPKDIVDTLAKRGIKISERLLRKRARELGACRVFGKTMYLLPEDVSAIMEASRPQPKEKPQELHSGYAELVRMRKKQKLEAAK